MKIRFGETIALTLFAQRSAGQTTPRHSGAKALGKPGGSVPQNAEPN